MKKVILLLLFAVIFNLGYNRRVFAQTVAGEAEKIEAEIEKERILRKKIEKEKIEPEITKKEELLKRLEIQEQVLRELEARALALIEEKVLIKTIKVIGVTLIPEIEIINTTWSFKNRELTLKEIQKIADLVTDIYRQKGYVTSRAYIPPQKITEGILEIRVIEGKTGKIECRGNRYFSSKLLEKRIALKKGEPFNYDILRSNLIRINEHPDRNVKAVLAPGREPGDTDIILETKDFLPIHLGFDYDNFGSRFVDQDRFRTTFTHNNLLGWDDTLIIQHQLVEGNYYHLNNFRYLLPATESLEMGFAAAFSMLQLRKEYEDLNTRSKSKLYSIFASQSLIKQENIDFGLNFGFDYKDVFNFQLDNETSRDRLRIFKVGFDLDMTDDVGRTLITDEFNLGVADIMGGLKKQDSRASRTGSGGKFFKDTLNLIRLQRMPFSSMLLWKNQFQFTPYILTAAEQFQIGGTVNVRGYPPAELVGDRGYSSTFEWSFPLYFVPRDTMFPFSKAKLYDAVKIVPFYDWANTRLRRPQAGEEKNKTLRASGVGMRLNLPEDFSFRIDVGWPLDNTPSDNKHAHTWTEISKSF